MLVTCMRIILYFMSLTQTETMFGFFRFWRVFPSCPLWLVEVPHTGPVTSLIRYEIVLYFPLLCSPFRVIKYVLNY